MSTAATSPARLIGFALVYFVLAAVPIATTRFDGGIAHIWIASALLTAQLMRSDTRDWGRIAIACALSGMVATSLFGLGPAASLPLAMANIADTLIGAAILRRLGKREDYLASLGNVALFVGAAAIMGPLISALIAAAVAAWVTGMPYWALCRDWFAAHMLGMLVFAPPFSMFLRQEFGSWARALTGWRRVEAAGLFAAMAGVTALAFAQDHIPLLFLPMLPLLIITFRLERVGAAIGVMILVTIGGALSALGHGPVHYFAATPSQRSVFLEFYFAISVLTVLPAAAELRQRKEIFRRLLESERRFKLITESASDIVLELDPQGVVSYVSPSVTEITGFTPEQLIGRRPQELLSGPDARTFLGAHRSVHKQPGVTATIEYRSRIADGSIRWFEAKTRGIVDEQGVVIGSVSAIRDISDRKTMEMHLAHAATTDGLTGLGNRRAFDALLDRRLTDCAAGLGGGCIAIFDIDFFKRVNDQHGHAAGDRVLESFAAIALGAVRPDDFVARLGGEEFGLILPGVTMAQAEQICDRLRHTVARSPMRAAPGATISITVSAGLAALGPHLTRDAVMRAADKALYAAKTGGRDRLAIAA
ncbi:diguanylate cyclase [Sphingomonas sp. GlSt437]|uniref:sensor domain-containing diguanylate cyclase n=2 Tax=Pseudomonadota TaxID=1224 RepID=UPI003A85F6AC